MAGLTTFLLVAGLAALTAFIKLLRLPAGHRLRYNAITAPAQRLRRWVDNPEGWQRRHFVAAPFGGLFSTWLWALRYQGDLETGLVLSMAQMASWGALTYGLCAVAAEGVLEMFYFFAKRRRDINAAEKRAREETREEIREENRQETLAALNAVAARFDREPDATPADVINALRAELSVDRMR